MKIKREPSKRKPIREVKVNRNYSGEASAYWDFLGAVQHPNEEGMPAEDVLANPDVLSDENTLFGRELTEEGELRLEAIREAWASLSPQQKKAVELCGLNGCTAKVAAEQLGIKETTVKDCLKRAREKIKRTYNRLKMLQY